MTHLTSSKTDHLLSITDFYYKTLNEAFFAQLAIAKEESEGLNYDFKSLEKALSKFKDEGSSSYEECNQNLRDFIHANKENEILAEMLFESVADGTKFSLFKMLLKEGVKPETITLPFKTDCDLESLGWVTLITFNPENYSNLDFFKLVLKYHPIDAQGLTYILWLMCQKAKEGFKDQEIEVMKFLLSKGATWDATSIAEYPPIILSGHGIIPSFTDVNQKI